MQQTITGNARLADDVEITVAIHDRRWHDLLPNISVFCERIIRHVLKKHQALWYHAEWANTPLEVACVMSNDLEVQRLNARFRGQDKPTNVLSFEADPDGPQTHGAPRVLGDIILSLETLIREAAEQHKSLQDHTTHMLVHGTLHLLGLDHQHEQEAEAMEQNEISVLQELGIANPYQLQNRL
ncbi:MAG: rRNA maturation RNase YbeY [Rickettsiales bacterium]|nr:rRNA maturation RNase YbeY [Rickettsiales bacterium]